ncbi:MAG: O-antigen ligase family protein [candidate division KSB1 bacterium]|nr:O-antigen ligase family protein [candidate division KSB1 bacterium]
MNKIQLYFFRILVLLIGIYLGFEYYFRLRSIDESESIIVYQLLKSIIIIFFFTYTLLNISTKNSSIFKWTIIWSIYIYITSVFHTNQIWNVFAYVYQVLFWPLSILFFYIFFKKSNEMLLNNLIALFCTLLLIFSFFFFREYNYVNQYLTNTMLQLNISYFTLLILPWCFFISNKMLKIFSQIIILAVVAFSLKRTAIISYFFALLGGYGLKIIMKKGAKKFQYFLIYLVILILILGIFVKINDFNEEWIYKRFLNITDDRGSYRLEIYKTVIGLLQASSLVDLIFGHGHNEVKNEMFDGLSAHNDWLECTYDYGIIGLIIYILLHLIILRRAIYLYKIKSNLAVPLLSSYLIFFTMSMFSHLIMYPYVFIIMTILWGTVFGMSEKSFSSDTKSTVIKW